MAEPETAPDDRIRAASDALAAAGRIAIAAVFLLAGLAKILAYGETLERMRGFGVEPAELWLPASIALELGAGAVLASGRGPVWQAALALAAFTIVVNATMHPFWRLPPERAAVEIELFFKNVAIVGGLLALAALHQRRRAGRDQ